MRRQQSPMRDLIALFLLLAVPEAGVSARQPDSALSRTASSVVAAVVRHAPTLNGRVEGSIQQLTGENVTPNGGSVVTGDLYVPGTPTLRLNGQPSFGGIVEGSGSSQPSGYRVTLNGSATLGRLVTRTDPVAMPPVPTPPAATGTRNVVLNAPGQGVGNWGTVRDLTLNGNVGVVSVPPGTYRNFTANGNSGFELGVAGSVQAAQYNLQQLTMNGQTELRIVGPVHLTLNGQVSINGSAGSGSMPTALALDLAQGGVTLNGGGTLYATVRAPQGTVTINGNARLVGSVVSDRLTVNGNGTLTGADSDTTAPVVQVTYPAEGAVTSQTQLTVIGTVTDDSPSTVTVNGIQATVTGNTFTALVSLPIDGPQTLTVVASDGAGNSTSIARSVVRDTSPPILTVRRPSRGTVTNASVVTVAGTVVDGTAVNVSVNGVSASRAGESYSATVSIGSEGSNVVTVIAIDEAGNEAQVTTSVNRDVAAPIIDVTSPADGSIVRAVRIAGSVSDGTRVMILANDQYVSTGFGGAFDRTMTFPEGPLELRIVAKDAAGNIAGVTRNLTVDRTPPSITDLSPATGAIVNGRFADVSGRVSDLSFVTVTVGSVLAVIGADGRFTAADVPIPEGETSIAVRAVDAAQNVTEVALGLVGADLTSPSNPVVFSVISPTRLGRQTIVGRAESEAQVIITGGAETAVSDAAYGSGLFFTDVPLNLGVNHLLVVARDAAGNASGATTVTIAFDPLLEAPPPGSAAHINQATRNTLRGLTGTELPRPLIAVVTDTQGAPVAGVPVRFMVLHGGGRFVGASDTIEVSTDNQGYAIARYVCGEQVIPQIVGASYAGNTLTPCLFMAHSFKAWPTARTRVLGEVLDQNMRALPNVLVRIGGQQARTDARGQFVVDNVGAGPHQLLELVGRNQVTLPGRWPNISYDVDVLPGIDNDLGHPLFLPKVNGGVAMPVDSNGIVTQDTSVEVVASSAVPPVRVVARAGTRVTFPPDVTDRRLSVTLIPADRIPMELDEGRVAGLYVSVQPSGAVFDPPLEISFPNLDGRSPGDPVLLMSFDHDVGRYVQVGTGHVSADGLNVRSDPGNGIHVGAWHAFPSPEPCVETVVESRLKIKGNPELEGKFIFYDAAFDGPNQALRTTQGIDLGRPPSFISYALTTLVCTPTLVKLQNKVVAAEIERVEVNYDGSARFPIVEDDGRALSPPPDAVGTRATPGRQLRNDSPGAHRYPLGFVANSSLQIQSATFFLKKKLDRNVLILMSAVSTDDKQSGGGGKFRFASDTYIGPEDLSFTLGGTFDQSLDDATKAYPTFAVRFNLLRADDLRWSDAAFLSNELYVTGRVPLSTTYHSLVKLSTEAAASDSTPDDSEEMIVGRIWSSFAGRSLSRPMLDPMNLPYGGTLRYLANEDDPSLSDAYRNNNTSSLLVNRSGTSRAWAELFVNALKCQGIDRATMHSVTSAYDSPIAISPGSGAAQLLLRPYETAPAPPEGIEVESCSPSNRPDVVFDQLAYASPNGGPSVQGSGGIVPGEDAVTNPPKEHSALFVVAFGEQWYDPAYALDQFQMSTPAGRVYWLSRMLWGFRIQCRTAQGSIADKPVSEVEDEAASEVLVSGPIEVAP